VVTPPPIPIWRHFCLFFLFFVGFRMDRRASRRGGTPLAKSAAYGFIADHRYGE
jgi:hypothetical protein